MSVKYRVKTKPNNIKKESDHKYYAVPVLRGSVDIKRLSRDIAAQSSLTRGDVMSVIYLLSPLIENYLHDGYSVHIDELGIFSLSASSEGLESPEACTPHKVKAQKICFRADPVLRKNLKQVKFERDNNE